MKLNLGCGLNKRAGYVNVDKYAACEPDRQIDLEVLPWPFGSGEVDEVLFNHSLEHIGQQPSVFLGVIQELYRVCKADAQVLINVPHPRHDHFISDPTHVRPITPLTLALFSKRLNREWQRVGAANSLLGLYLNVDFELVRTEQVLDAAYREKRARQEITEADLAQWVNEHNNVVTEYRMVLRVVK